MKPGLRAAVVATAAAVALAFTGSALAAYTPHLTISHTPLALGGGGTTDVTVTFDQSDDATAKATIYVPQGYTGTLGAAAGTQLGTIDASIIAFAISPTQPLPLKGVIQADDPAKYVANPCSPGTHEAVWLLRLQAAGTELAVPGYVDTVTAPTEAPLGKFKLQFCLPSPYIPPSAGGAMLGAKLVSAPLHLSNVFALPRRQLETIGSPGVSTTVSGTKPFHHLVAVLTYTSGGGETIVSEGGIPLRPRAKPKRVSIRLLDQIVSIPAGARLRLTLAATSTAQNPANALYLLGVPNGSRVHLGRISVTLPVLRKPIS